jgi:hypothetical protein
MIFTMKEVQDSSEIRQALSTCIHHLNNSWGVAVPVRAADELFQDYAEKNARGVFYKGVRPWLYLDFPAKYPDADMLLGVEVEAGFKDSGAYFKALSYATYELEHVTCDREGLGTYPLEATFPPVPSDQLLSENCQLTKYYENVLSKQSEFWNSDDCVGTHFNVSWPGIQTLTSQQRRRLSEVTDFFYAMSDEPDWEDGDEGDRPDSQFTAKAHCVLGRLPYGSVNIREGSRAEFGALRTVWLEMKLFNSTNDINKLRWYKEVTINIARYIRDDDYAKSFAKLFSKLAKRSPLDEQGYMTKTKEAKRAVAG